MDEALHDVPLQCEFRESDAGNTRLPDETTILQFCRLLETHDLAPPVLATANEEAESRAVACRHKSAHATGDWLGIKHRLSSSIDHF